MSRFIGHQAAGLESQIYEEYVRLSSKVKMLIITEEAVETKNDNITIKKTQPVLIPKLRGLFKIILYSVTALRCRNEYDIVYVRTFSPPELIASILTKKLLKKPLIVLVPGTWMFVDSSLRTRIFRWIYRQCLLRANHIIFYSSKVCDELESVLGRIDKSKMMIFKNAVDTSIFKPYAFPHDNTILFVGRINPLKKIEDIINTIPYVNKEFPDVELRIVGVTESVRYMQLLQNLVKRLGCQQNITFCGPVPHNKILGYYITSKIFITMAKNEGIPRALLEAMSCGKVIIAAPNSGVSDVIIDGLNGFLISNDQPKLLAEKIIEILKDEKLQRQLSEAAIGTVREQHNWNEFINNLVNLIKTSYASQ